MSREQQTQHEPPLNDLPSVTTTAGDAGQSTLMTGGKIRKDDSIFELLGTIDELNSLLGVCNLHVSSEQTTKIVAIQNKLFDLSACIACNRKPGEALTNFVHVLEKWSVELEKSIPPFQAFILPGGCAAASYVHLARTVARRAERCFVRSMYEHSDLVGPELCPVLNRLSDFLFILARFENVTRGIPEVQYQSETL